MIAAIYAQKSAAQNGVAEADGPGLFPEIMLDWETSQTLRVTLRELSEIVPRFPPMSPNGGRPSGAMFCGLRWARVGGGRCREGAHNPTVTPPVGLRPEAEPQPKACSTGSPSRRSRRTA